MGHTTLAGRLRAHAAASPDAPALRIVRAGQPDHALSRAALLTGAQRAADGLYAQGLRAGDLAVIILQHGEALAFVHWGCILLGAVPSLLPPLSEKLNPEKYRADLAALIVTSAPSMLLSDAATMAAAGLGDLHTRIIDVGQLNPAAAPAPTPAEDAEAIAIVQHSSGSTGLQKGVALSHRAILNQLDAYSAAIGLSTQDRIASWLPLYHDMGLIACWLMPMLCGVPLIWLSPFEWVRAPVRLLQAISLHAATLCWLPNFALTFMANPQRVRDRDLTALSLASLRAIINCSEPTYAESHTRFAGRFAGLGLRPTALTTCYAMAENVFAVSCAGFTSPVREDVIDSRALAELQLAQPAQPGVRAMTLLSQGPPLPNIVLLVMDAHDHALPERQIGEIALHSDCMLSSYLHRPDLTALAMMQHEGRTLFRTGDLGYLAEGEVFITGRKKDLIIVGGKNVHPQDLESLANQVPGVHPGRTVAFGMHDASAGTEEVVLLAESQATDAERRYEISDAIRLAIAQNTDVVVRRIEILPLGTLIKTSSGKIARADNKRRFQSQIKVGG